MIWFRVVPGKPSHSTSIEWKQLKMNISCYQVSWLSYPDLFIYTSLSLCYSTKGHHFSWKWVFMKVQGAIFCGIWPAEETKTSLFDSTDHNTWKKPRTAEKLKYYLQLWISKGWGLTLGMVWIFWYMILKLHILIFCICNASKIHALARIHRQLKYLSSDFCPALTGVKAGHVHKSSTKEPFHICFRLIRKFLVPL